MITILPSILLIVASAQSASPKSDLLSAMVGDWAGVLEYRDYSEPPTSTKRVFLPTWLTVISTKEGITRHFIYDDGPKKTVEETDIVTVDPIAGTYSETDLGKPPVVQQMYGYLKLKNGKGDLILHGSEMDDGKLSETQTTLSVKRNLVSWTLEVRSAVSKGAYSFRHRFTFTRKQTPHA